jgi:NDP-sugar pyrophosphorylase family protein
MAGSSGRAPRALILTAGFGNRLRPLTYVRAKPAVPVNGLPLVRRILRWLAAQGIGEAVLNLHHRPETIEAVVGDGSDLGVRVRYSWEQPLLGSAGGPRHALPLLTDGRDEPFLIVNGDTLTDVDVKGVLAEHDRSGAAVTMALIPNPRPDKYGGVLVSDDGFVTGFTRAGLTRPSFHFIGVQAVGRRAFEGLEDNVPAESVNALYPRLIASDPRSVAAFVCGAAFRDIGTPRDYLDTSMALAAVEGNSMAAGARNTVHPSADIVRSALWDDVEIGEGARLLECVVCDGARVRPGAVYEGAALLPGKGRQAGDGERIEGELLVRAI